MKRPKPSTQAQALSRMRAKDCEEALPGITDPAVIKQAIRLIHRRPDGHAIKLRLLRARQKELSQRNQQS